MGRFAAVAGGHRRADRHNPRGRAARVRTVGAHARHRARGRGVARLSRGPGRHRSAGVHGRRSGGPLRLRRCRCRVRPRAFSRDHGRRGVVPAARCDLPPLRQGTGDPRARRRDLPDVRAGGPRDRPHCPRDGPARHDDPGHHVAALAHAARRRDRRAAAYRRGEGRIRRARCVSASTMPVSGSIAARFRTSAENP